MSKVKQHLINTLANAYGDPDWPEPVFMMREWEESFKKYSETQLRDAAVKYIRRSKYKSFPNIAHIFDILDAQPVIEEFEGNPFKLPLELLAPYQDFSKWHSENEYSYVWKQRILDGFIVEFEKLHPTLVEKYKQDTWRCVYALAWKYEWLPTQVDNEIEYLEKDRRKDTMKYLRGLKASSKKSKGLGGVIGRILTKCMPDEVRKEISS